MSTRAVPVTEAEAGQPGVEQTTAVINGGTTVNVFIRVEQIDDLDGKTTTGVQSVPFSIPVENKDDETGEITWTTEDRVIDLGPDSRKKFDTALAKYVAASRVVELPAAQPQPRTRRSTRSPQRQWSARVRDWAPTVKMDVPDRGRIADDVQAAYVVAHPEDPKPE